MAATRLLLAMVSTGFDNLDLDISRDYHMLVFTTTVSLLTLLLFGLAPAIRGTRIDVNRTPAANARGASGGRTLTRRTNVIGIRIALGAAGRAVRRMVLGETLWMVAVDI